MLASSENKASKESTLSSPLSVDGLSSEIIKLEKCMQKLLVIINAIQKNCQPNKKKENIKEIIFIKNEQLIISKVVTTPKWTE